MKKEDISEFLSPFFNAMGGLCVSTGLLIYLPLYKKKLIQNEWYNNPTIVISTGILFIVLNEIFFKIINLDSTSK